MNNISDKQLEQYLLRELPKDKIIEIEKLKWWNWSLTKMKKEIELFNEQIIS